MRISLKKGKQREILFKEKKRIGSSWRDFAKILNINERRLVSYYNEESLIPEELFNKLKDHKKSEKFIVDRKENNWGRTKGGKVSVGNTKTIQNPEESIE